MALFSLGELIDIVIMTVAVGFIFMIIFRNKNVARVLHEGRYPKSGFDWDAFKFSALVTAPAIILHELGHKFVALGFGFEAVFHAAYTWLGIGIVLRLLNFGFIFFVPGYVMISPGATPLQSSIIAAAGPFTNLAIFIVAVLILKYRHELSTRARFAWYLTKQINIFLFFFNMLPFWLFDGYKVFNGLIQTFF